MTDNIFREVMTPSYIFDIAVLKDRVKKMRELLGNIKLCYAMKANPFLIGDLQDAVDCFEVCSHGEFRICMRKNIPAEKIVYSGVYKSAAETEEAIAYCRDKAIYTVESVSQFVLLEKLAQKFSLKLRVVLRLSSSNQFGMDEDTIFALLQRFRNNSLIFEGIHYYSGTQKRAEKIDKEILFLKGFADKIKEKGYSFPRLEYGPGLAVSYFQGENDVSEWDLLKDISRKLNTCFDVSITLETGRFLAAECGKYLTKIVDIKKTYGNYFCIVDGGINHLNYYNQMMAMKKPFIRQCKIGKAEVDGDAEFTICGSLCTTADVLVKSYPLKDAGTGDLLIFSKAGAYSVTEGIYLFLSRDLPFIYIRKEDGSLIAVRENLRTDPING